MDLSLSLSLSLSHKTNYLTQNFGMPAVEGNSNKAKALAFISTISINPS